MSWFRRTPEPPRAEASPAGRSPVEAVTSAVLVEPYAGTTAAELRSWLRQRLAAMRRPGQDMHLLVLTAPGDERRFVQVLGMTDGVRLEIANGGARLDRDVLATSGWQEPEPGTEWPFWWADPPLDDGGIEQALDLLDLAIRTVLGVPDGRVGIEDEPYDALR